MDDSSPDETAPDPGEVRAMLAETGQSLPFNEHLGVRVRTVEAGRCVVVLPEQERLENHIGTPHAIAQLAPAELAGSLAAGSHLPDLLDDGWVPVIAGLDVRFRAPAHGEVVAVAEVDGAEVAGARQERGDGGGIHVPVEIDIRAGGGPDTVAVMTGHYVFLPPE